MGSLSSHASLNAVTSNSRQDQTKQTNKQTKQQNQVLLTWEICIWWPRNEMLNLKTVYSSGFHVSLCIRNTELVRM